MGDDKEFRDRVLNRQYAREARDAVLAFGAMGVFRTREEVVKELWKKPSAQVRQRPAAQVRKRPAAQERTTPAAKRPAAQARKRPSAAEQESVNSDGQQNRDLGQHLSQSSHDSHNGSYDEPPQDETEAHLRQPSELLSRLGPVGAAPFRGLL